jgi:hypothetical protein
MDVRILSCGVISVLLALAGSPAVRSQDPPPVQPAADQYFAGVITDLSESSVTITRTVLGKSTIRKFAITSETVIQGGTPKVKSRVTVKWVSAGEGDRAVKIILRGSVPPPKKGT